MDWTIFGAGSFIWDIIDAIEEHNGKVKYIVLNRDIPAALSQELAKRFPIISLKDYKQHNGDKDNNFLGFVNANKEPLLEELEKIGILRFPNVIHPKSIISNSSLPHIGKGNFMGAGSVIAPYVKVGNFNFINRASSIGHNTTIGNFNHIAPGATICGICKIGNKNHIGTGSTIIDRITIGDNITIGAGAVVVKNISSPGTYIGVPAKVKGV